MDYLNWLAGSLGFSIGVLLLPVIGYAIGGTIGVYLPSAFMLTGLYRQSASIGSGDSQPEVAALFGFGTAIILMIPGLLIRYGLAKRDLPVLQSAGISFALWFIAVHASFFSHTQVNEYSAVLGALTFSICYSGFSHPVRRVRRQKAASQTSAGTEQSLFTVNFKDGNPSNWVDERQVLEWYRRGRINASVWVYSSGTREWLRLKNALNLPPNEKRDATIPRPDLTNSPAEPVSPAVPADGIPSLPTSATPNLSQGSQEMAAKLRSMASSELMAMLETGALRPEAQSEITTELERRGIKIK